MNERSGNLVSPVVNKIISSKRAALLDPTLQLAKCLKTSTIERLTDAASLDIKSASRYISKECRRAEFLALEQMPEIYQARGKAIETCAKERGPRMSL